ncbi:MAG: AAA family ATPase [Syntrophales bacterium]
MKTRDSKVPGIVSVTSGKGGVGKTFITCNLAAALVRNGEKILVVDGDLGLANIDIMLGVNPRNNLKDVIFGKMGIRDIIVPTKGGFDLVPSSSGVREMAQLLFEKVESVKEMIRSLRGYDKIILDTGAGISEVVLQFNLLASRNIIVINKELTSLTDAYAMIKTMYQVFGRSGFGIIVNCTADDREGDEIYRHISSICEKFLNIRPNYLGSILDDSSVPKSILQQQIAVLSAPKSRISQNFQHITKMISSWRV